MCPLAFGNMIPNYPNLYLLFFASLSFSFSLIVCLVLTQTKWNLDVPNNRSSHVSATATLGGLGFAIPMILVLCCQYNLWLISALLLIAIIGGIDDIKGLSYRVRLLFQLIAALMITCGAELKLVSPLIENNTAELLLTIFMLMGFMNAANFIDGLNGLLSGCFIITCAACLFFGFKNYIWVTALFSSLGFWILNTRGKIFMGDLGSTFLGLWLGSMALSHQSIGSIPAIGGLCMQEVFMILGPMLFLWGDVVITLLSRLWKRVSLAEAHREHIIHRLADNGYSHKKVLALYANGTAYMSVCIYAYTEQAISLAVLTLLYVAPQTALAMLAYKKSKKTF